MNSKTFKNRITSILKDNAIDREVRKRKRGKLDTKSLGKIGVSEKIFKKKEALGKREYKFTFLIDVSGSMSGWRMEATANAFIKLFELLNEIKGIQIKVFLYARDILLLKDYEEELDMEYFYNFSNWLAEGGGDYDPVDDFSSKQIAGRSLFLSMKKGSSTHFENGATIPVNVLKVSKKDDGLFVFTDGYFNEIARQGAKILRDRDALFFGIETTSIYNEAPPNKCIYLAEPSQIFEASLRKISKMIKRRG